MAVTARKIVIVKKPTRLDQLVSRFNSIQQAKFYIEHIKGDWADYEAEHIRYREALDLVTSGIGKIARIHVIDWLQIPNYQFNDDDIVATVGQDGLIVNALKYLGKQQLVGFNSDKKRWDGSLAQFSPLEAPEVAEGCLKEGLSIKEITKATVSLSDGQELRAVNDFFVGVSNHSSARYEISYKDRKETQSSSGVIVSTPLGRSAWLKSIIAGASGIVGRMQNKGVKIIEGPGSDDWSANHLWFAVREPFPSVSSGTGLIFGRISEDGEFCVESKMGENGIVFSDGIQGDCLGFNYSMKASFGIARDKGRLVVATLPSSG